MHVTKTNRTILIKAGKSLLKRGRAFMERTPEKEAPETKVDRNLRLAHDEIDKAGLALHAAMDAKTHAAAVKKMVKAEKHMDKAYTAHQKAGKR